MNVLIIGGTGNISMGIIKALQTRFGNLGGGGEKLKITVFNRGKSTDILPPAVTRLHGDRTDFASFENQFANTTWDAVIDMICYTPQEAESDLRAFAGKTAHFIFCSTVCTYGNTQTIIPTLESTPQRPHSTYGQNKLACEQLFLSAYHDGKFGPHNGLTIFRPSHTIGPGNNLHGQLGGGGSPTFFARLRKGLPVIVSGDGHGLWQLASSDDVGLGFAYAIGRQHTFGEAYNVVADKVQTWDEVTATIAHAIGAPAPKIVHIPTDLLLAIDPKRYGVVKEIFQYHAVYSNAKINRDIPEFQNKTPIEDTIRNAVAWMEKHNRIPSLDADTHEQTLIDLYQQFEQTAKTTFAPNRS